MAAWKWAGRAPTLEPAPPYHPLQMPRCGYIARVVPYTAPPPSPRYDSEALEIQESAPTH